MNDEPATSGQQRRPRGQRSGFTPFPGASSHDEDENEWWLQREISLIENLLKEEGELPRKEIGEKLGCKYWGRCASAARSRRRSSGASSARAAATGTRRPAERSARRPAGGEPGVEYSSPAMSSSSSSSRSAIPCSPTWGISDFSRFRRLLTPPRCRSERNALGIPRDRDGAGSRTRSSRPTGRWNPPFDRPELRSGWINHVRAGPIHPSCITQPRGVDRASVDATIGASRLHRRSSSPGLPEGAPLGTSLMPSSAPTTWLPRGRRRRCRRRQ
jgi:hypothetical protein